MSDPSLLHTLAAPAAGSTQKLVPEARGPARRRLHLGLGGSARLGVLGGRGEGVRGAVPVVSSRSRGTLPRTQDSVSLSTKWA